MKRFDLMHQINTRGTFVVSKWAIPYLEKAANPHILMISPPLDMKEKWFAPHTAYSIAKFGMSLVVLGLAGELRDKGIAVNALWPRTVIATAAVQNLLGGEAVMRQARKPEIMADAAYACSPPRRANSPDVFSSTTRFWQSVASPISTATGWTRTRNCHRISFCPMTFRRRRMCIRSRITEIAGDLSRPAGRHQLCPQIRGGSSRRDR
jgi:NAD(P)-dependent dehydrogenase (short-subunit alcohol dehydrogenase family)